MEALSVGSETWVSYIERLQQYFVANDIKGEDRQRAVLLSVSGASTYQLIRSVVSPEKRTEKTFEQLVTLTYEGALFSQAVSHNAAIRVQL